MTSNRPTDDRRLRWVATLSLVPWAAFVVSTPAAVPFVAHRSLDWERVPGSALGYLPLVALPCALPIAVARPGWMRAVSVVLLTGVSAVAGVLIVAIDDAQAGFAVFYVPYVALALTVLVGIARAVQDVVQQRHRIRSRGWPPPGGTC